MVSLSCSTHCYAHLFSLKAFDKDKELFKAPRRPPSHPRKEMFFLPYCPSL